MTTIPTVQDLRDSILDNLMAEYSIVVNPFGLSFLNALAGVLAGIFYLYYLAIASLQKNICWDTADSEANGGTLERWGRLILGRSPFPATSGEYTVEVTGTAGAIIPATSVFIADDSSESPGALFQIVGGAYALTGTGDSIVIRALVGGIDSKLLSGNTLTSDAPFINADSLVTVLTEDVAPEDAETLEDYRAKITEKVQLEPGSWSAVDYRLVGIPISGVQQVYAYATSGASAEVDVYLQGTVPGTAIAGSVITAYETALELVRPLGVFDVHYNACPINDVDVTITMGSFTAFTVAEKALIETALETFINGLTPFIASCDTVAARKDVLATYNLNAVISAAVPGKGFSGVTFDVGGTPSVLYQLDNGNLTFLNSITYA